jgi:hypothetical protein
MVFLLPAWANRPKEYKKGGKVKKDKKPKKAPAMSQNVKVNVKVGDSVLLHKGKAPRRSNPGVAKRFLSPGSAFGGGLPGPLSSLSYASAPPVAMPLGRMDFINSGDGVLNRGRDRRDDIPINVNPSNIRADVNPSIRYQPSSNPNAIQHAPAPIESSLPFQGRQPRLNLPDTSPSMNAVPPPIRIPRQSPISSVFSSQDQGQGLTRSEFYANVSASGSPLASELDWRDVSASASASASSKPLSRGPRMPPKKPIRGDMSPPALRRGGTVF